MADDSPPAPAVGCCTRRCCPGRAATNPEVLGFVWTRIGGTLNFIAILTLLPALSVLAKRQGGCHKFACGGEDDDMPCDDSGKEDGLWYCNLSDEPAALCSEADECRVYGLAPTSVISAVATISGVVCAVLMPFIGAIVDYSTKRWEVTVGAALLLVATNAVQIGLSGDSWFAMTLIQSTLGAGSYMAAQARAPRV